MDFVVVMLFTRSLYKVFQLECLILLIIEIVILNQISAWSCLLQFSYKKACKVVSQSSKKEKRTFPHEIIFVFIWFFIGTILSKNPDQKWGVQKKDKNKGWSYNGGVGSVGWGVSIEGGSNLLHTMH